MTLPKPGFIFMVPCFFFIFSCTEKAEQKESKKLHRLIAEVKETYAPDARTVHFDIQAEKSDQTYILRGETTEPKASDALKKKLHAEDIPFIDSILVLPDTDALDENIQAIVKISVGNLRDKPKHSAQLVTQALLGTPLKVFKKKGGWYYVQTPDGYLAWVDYGGIKNMTEAAFLRWKTSDKVIVTQTTANSYIEARTGSQTVSDLVAGNILELVTEGNGFYEVAYPDEKRAFVAKKAAKPFQDWILSLDLSGETLVTTAKRLMGLPYLWGGTSSKGVDCSGYTKTVFFLNGMIIPRDASQQIRTGKVVDTGKNFGNLAKGDLLFFGRPATDSTAERVIHVGMWIGDNQFIHSMGQVHISNFDTQAEEFDAYNYNRYLRSKRILNQTDDELIYLKNDAVYTVSQTSR